MTGALAVVGAGLSAALTGALLEDGFFTGAGAGAGWASASCDAGAADLPPALGAGVLLAAVGAGVAAFFGMTETS
jgi:hypothetical protein